MKVFGIELSDYGPTALCALFIILVFLGYWVPRRQADKWEEAAKRSDALNDKLADNFDLVIQLLRGLTKEAGVKERPHKDRSEP